MHDFPLLLVLRQDALMLRFGDVGGRPHVLHQRLLSHLLYALLVVYLRSGLHTIRILLCHFRPVLKLVAAEGNCGLVGRNWLVLRGNRTSAQRRG